MTGRNLVMTVSSMTSSGSDSAQTPDSPSLVSDIGTWVRGLPLWGKVALAAGVVALVCSSCGLGIALVAPSPEPVSDPVPAGSIAVSEPTETSVPVETSRPDAASPASPTPKVEKRKATETRSVPYSRRTVQDPSMTEGTRRVRVKGVPGVKTLTYEITLVDGKQTDKRLVAEKVTKQPITEVVAVGTKPKRQCDPNYSGCVPIASDVD
ncbi:MAG TPA: G5 domain-containing protein, partial [Micromonosporaceae bacterium]|nr:G5 domain-containing protein [Micromonosporaceae bacterium]